MNFKKYQYRVYRDVATGEGDTGGSSMDTAADVNSTEAASNDVKLSVNTAKDDAINNTSASKDASQKSETKAYWPDDWRNNISKGDEKLLNRLSRYASPEAMATALIAAQNKISSGDFKQALSKTPSAEELKAWRTEQGIPETPEKYDLDLGGGLKVGDEDRPFVDQFLKSAHGTNQTQDQVKASLRAYYDVQEKITEQIQQKDLQYKESAEETLRAEWGNDYRRNINLVNGLLDGVGSPDLKDKILHGRLSDGTPIGASPDALKMLISLALINNPAGTVVPNAGGNVAQTVGDEIGKIEKVMRENRKAYDKDESMQARYRELLGAREKLKDRK